MKKIHVHFIFTAITLLFLMSGLNMIQLFDWDEVNFAEAAREMSISKNYLYVQIGFEPFWEKPPLFIWFQAFFQNLFHTHSSWVYKMPNVIAGVISVNLVYHIGDRLGKRMLGAFWALATLFTFAPFIYWRSGIIDPVFNLFIFLAIYKWYQITQSYLREERAHLYYLMVGVFLGLAFLTKGPVAVLIFGLVVVFVTAIRSKWHELLNPLILLSVLGFLLSIGLWVLPLLNSNGQEFLTHFFWYQVELFKGQIPYHNQPWFYHIVVLLILAFPTSTLALPHLFGNRVMDRDVDTWNLMMRTLFWVVLVVFSITTTKIIHYSSLCWWPLTYFGAYQVYLLHTNRWHFPYWLNLPLFISGLALILALWILPLVVIIEPTPQLLLQKLDVFSLGILNAAPKWNWTTLLPATLFTFWFLGWLILSLFKKNPSPGYLFLISGSVALISALTLIPQTADVLQKPLVSKIKSLRAQGKFVEVHGFKTYALYFFGEFQPKDFQNLKPLNPAAANEEYPQQQNRRSHAHNPANPHPVYIITKNDHKPDDWFLNRYKTVENFSGYVLWVSK